MSVNEQRWPIMRLNQLIIEFSSALKFPKKLNCVCNNFQHLKMFIHYKYVF